MYEITNLSDSEDEFKPDPGTITKIEAIDYNVYPYENIYSNHVGDNGASSSGSNIRSSLLGMGYSPDLIDKAIRQNDMLCEDNMDLLLETLFAYTALQKPKPISSHVVNGSVVIKDEELGQGSGKRKALLISHSESSGSLDCLSDDDQDISSRNTNPLKEEPDEISNGIDDNKASLLRMRFTIEEVEFAMKNLGEDEPVNELVDFIFAAQMANADEIQK